MQEKSTDSVVSGTSRLSGIRIRTLVVIGTDCIGSCKSNYHTVMTTMAAIYTYCGYWICFKTSVALVYFFTSKSCDFY
jgi:hypothetical protein